MKNKTNNFWKLVVVFFLLSLLIRLIPLLYDALSFHYDMARDAFVVKQILEGDLKIQGPPTTTPGLYHGVLYYYLLAPFYFIAAGDPRIVAFFMAIINSLTVVPIMYLAKEIFKKSRLAILAGVLFIVAFEANQYALWLSNPSPAILTIGFFFYSLWIWKKGNIKGFYLAIFFAALSAQFQLFLLYLFLIIIVFKSIFRPRLSLVNFIKGGFIGAIVFSSFIASIIKFDSFSQLINGFSGISGSGQFDFRIQFTDYFFNYINRYADIFINNFFPTNILLGGLLGFASLYFIRRERFIIFCLLVNSVLFLFGGHNSAYVNVGMVTPAILAVVYLLNNFYKISKIGATLFLFLILVSNLYMLNKTAPRGQITLVIPKDMMLKNQLSLIDKTYELAGGKPFSINSVTLPLWTNTTWSYLYSYYGKQKYGYTPSFYGRDQVGLEGEKELEKISEPQTMSFLILEPPTAIPTTFYSQEIDSENGKTELVKEYEFASIKLQQRIPLND